ncbi:copper homeostasis protein CutC [Cesiribacter sp. SM1]|uniref:copper homeostasis protein CutC n=1 Tax=Cesiribacter sp. SM1 TaxID=2861196 RepID=UPI001CD283DF|nr:copper homeostasis protein CutC [Cesiribacter sp. SM1]
MREPEIEICVDSVESALQAQAGGATRVELCAGLSEGGLTPSAGLIEITSKSIHIPVHVLIRPRRGDFLYSAHEFDVMKRDIKTAKALGVAGIVLGVLKPDGQVDVVRTAELIAIAAPLSITFHRAFDMTPDPFKALEDVIGLKADRLLTSGQQPSALAGASLLAKLVQRAANRLIVMPGGGISAENIQELLISTGATAYHASARSRTSSQMHFRNHGLAMAATQQLSEYENMIADAALIARLCKACKDQSYRLGEEANNAL